MRVRGRDAAREMTAQHDRRPSDAASVCGASATSTLAKQGPTRPARSGRGRGIHGVWHNGRRVRRLSCGVEQEERLLTFFLRCRQGGPGQARTHTSCEGRVRGASPAPLLFFLFSRIPPSCWRSRHARPTGFTPCMAWLWKSPTVRKQPHLRPLRRCRRHWWCVCRGHNAPDQCCCVCWAVTGRGIAAAAAAAAAAAVAAAAAAPRRRGRPAR